jgi:hypothetical protein
MAAQRRLQHSLPRLGAAPRRERRRACQHRACKGGAPLDEAPLMKMGAEPSSAHSQV